MDTTFCTEHVDSTFCTAHQYYRLAYHPPPPSLHIAHVPFLAPPLLPLLAQVPFLAPPYPPSAPSVHSMILLLAFPLLPPWHTARVSCLPLPPPPLPPPPQVRAMVSLLGSLVQSPTSSPPSDPRQAPGAAVASEMIRSMRELGVTKALTL